MPFLNIPKEVQKMWGKKKCTAETLGEILSFKSRGLEGVTMVTVKFTVDGTEYTVKESLKYKSKAIKLGFLPIGQRKTPVLKGAAGEDREIGVKVRMKYDPQKPKRAYLPDNKGWMNA